MKALLSLLFALAAVSLYAQGGAVTGEEYAGNFFPAIQDDGFSGGDEPFGYLLLAPLNAYADPFTALSDYNFSFVRYSRRGYDYRYRRISLNGIELGDELTGIPYWNLLSVLRTARLPEQITPGIVPGEGALGMPGGERCLWIGTEDEQPGGRAGWMVTDRRFRTGFRFHVSTGMLRGGWAFSAAGTRRWGRDAHIRGVYSDDWSLLTSLSKKAGQKSRVNLLFAVAPCERGLRGAATREALGLSGNNLYNPYWGFQQGRTRNSRVRKSSEPLLTLSWVYDPGPRLHFHTALAYLWGKSSYSSLDWYDALNPMPDYYRYMPGFFANPDLSEAARQEWEEGDGRVTQVNWDELIYENRRGGGTPAYVVASRTDDRRNLQWVSRFRYEASEQVRWSGGIRLRLERTHRYNRLDDLLGGAYLTDIDQYLVDDEYYGDKLLNNLRDPDREVREGDRYGYDYALHYRNGEAWLLLRMRNRAGRLYGYGGVQAGWVSIRREGYYEKESFPGDESYGSSAPQGFTTYMVKGGVGYAFSPSHRIELSVLYGDAAPLAGNIFIAPDYRNRTIDRSQPVNLLGGELHYAFSGAIFTLSFNAYVTRSSGESAIYRYYDDLASVYSDLVLSGIDKCYAGAEAGASVDFTSRLSLRIAAGLASNSYASDPSAVQYVDKDGTVIADKVRSYLKGYKLSGTPQTVASAELRYSGRAMWLASLSVSYAGRNYISLSPIRRMKRVIDHAVSPEEVGLLTAQERLPDAATLNLFLSKTFRIRSNYLSFTLSVNNLANKKGIVQSGYEQMRLAKSGTGLNRSIAPFGSKYYYGYGRTYYATASFRF